jgi:hypothetical protein
VESDLIVEYFNCINQGIVLVYSVLSMEGKRNVWSPWYLMLKDKLRKVECKFYGNVISYRKDRIFLQIWVFNVMVMGKLELKCVQRHIHR